MEKGHGQRGDLFYDVGGRALFHLSSTIFILFPYSPFFPAFTLLPSVSLRRKTVQSINTKNEKQSKPYPCRSSLVNLLGRGGGKIIKEGTKETDGIRRRNTKEDEKKENINK